MASTSVSQHQFYSSGDKHVFQLWLKSTNSVHYLFVILSLQAVDFRCNLSHSDILFQDCWYDKQAIIVNFEIQYRMNQPAARKYK